MSLPPLVKEIGDMLPPDVPILSVYLVGSQFTYNNSRSMKVQSYYGRFDVVHKVQSQTVTKHNIDARHANANFHVVRQFYTKNKDLLGMYHVTIRTKLNWGYLGSH